MIGENIDCFEESFLDLEINIVYENLIFSFVISHYQYEECHTLLSISHQKKFILHWEQRYFEQLSVSPEMVKHFAEHLRI